MDPIPIESVLVTKPQNHFGEAAKKLQGLLFMLRENQEVFEIFCKYAHNFKYCGNYNFPHTLVNFIFNDLQKG
jgi:hypothetical protein